MTVELLFFDGCSRNPRYAEPDTAERLTRLRWHAGLTQQFTYRQEILFIA